MMSGEAYTLCLSEQHADEAHLQEIHASGF